MRPSEGKHRPRRIVWKSFRETGNSEEYNYDHYQLSACLPKLLKTTWMYLIENDSDNQSVSEK